MSFQQKTSTSHWLGNRIQGGGLLCLLLLFAFTLYYRQGQPHSDHTHKPIPKPAGHNIYKPSPTAFPRTHTSSVNLPPHPVMPPSKRLPAPKAVPKPSFTIIATAIIAYYQGLLSYYVKQDQQALAYFNKSDTLYRTFKPVKKYKAKRTAIAYYKQLIAIRSGLHLPDRSNNTTPAADPLLDEPLSEAMLQQAAEEALQTAAKWAKKKSLADIYNYGGLPCYEAKQYKAALIKYHKSQAIYQQLAKEHPEENFHYKFATLWECKGHCYSRLEKYPEAIQCFDESTKHYQALSDQDPAAIFPRARIAMQWGCKGLCALLQENYQEALTYYEKSAQGYQPLTAKYPTKYQGDLVALWAGKGLCHLRLQAYEIALSCFTKAILQSIPGYLNAADLAVKYQEKQLAKADPLEKPKREEDIPKKTPIDHVLAQHKVLRVYIKHFMEACKAIPPTMDSVAEAKAAIVTSLEALLPTDNPHVQDFINWAQGQLA